MKKIILVMVTIITFFVTDLFSQNQILARKEVELYLLTESLNIENQQHIFYKMESILPFVWENDSSR
jgi:phage-related holin